MHLGARLLNLGCGNSYHKEWTNIDFISKNEDVIAHNLLKGIPFPDNSYDAVYHSHVLEHFKKNDGKLFIQECYRVLKKNGVIRIVVPDLERIAKEYLKNMELALKGDMKARCNYEWIKLEMYDQTVRNQSGGNMTKYLFQEEIPNEKYVFERIGIEGKQIRQNFIKRKLEKQNNKAISNFKKKLRNRVTTLMRNGRYIFLTEEEQKALKIGLFRLGGEIHQWMYDAYSLGRLLKDLGFTDIKTCQANESSIPDWNTYQLDMVNDEVRKPDSLFMEARKL